MISLMSLEASHARLIYENLIGALAVRTNFGAHFLDEPTKKQLTRFPADIENNAKRMDVSVHYRWNSYENR